LRDWARCAGSPGRVGSSPLASGTTPEKMAPFTLSGGLPESSISTLPTNHSSRERGKGISASYFGKRASSKLKRTLSQSQSGIPLSMNGGLPTRSG
jgi:hypothetical protein